MYKECKTLKSNERQKEFERTLLKMMESQDFKSITVSALCRKMGTPRKAFLDVLQKNGLSQKMMERCFAKELINEYLDMTSIEAMKRASYIAAMLTLVTMWHHNGMKHSVGEMKKLVLEMFVNDSFKAGEN